MAHACLSLQFNALQLTRLESSRIESNRVESNPLTRQHQPPPLLDVLDAAAAWLGLGGIPHSSLTYQVPVVSGVAYASLKELTFTWLSFWCAMASNVVCAARGVVVKVRAVCAVGALDGRMPAMKHGIVDRMAGMKKKKRRRMWVSL